MLKAEDLKKIAGFLKVKEADLKAAIEAEKETDIELPADLHVFTEAELESRDSAQKNEGIKAGKEIGFKELKKAAGLPEDAPSKDPAEIVEAISAKAVKDAKIPVDAKVNELTTQNNLLTQKLAEKDTEIENEKKKSSQVATDRLILTAMPKNRAETLADDEYLDVIKAKHIKEVDGQQVVVGKDGEVLRDPKTTKPLDLATGLTTIFTERKWIAEGGAGGAGGRGGKDEKPANGVFTKRSEVIAHYEAQGKSINGEAGKEIVAKLNELSKADPSFDMNS